MKLRLIFGPDLLHCKDPLAKYLPPPFESGSMIFHLFDIPPAADAEDEATVREPIKSGHLFGSDYRVALNNQADARRHFKTLCRKSSSRQGDKRVVSVPILLRQV